MLSSDNPQIQMVAESLGCEVPFTRAAHLATDEASTIDVLLDVLERVAGFDVVVLLQPTSPFRTAKDIDSCLELMIRDGAPAVVSLCAVQDHPALVFKFQNDKKNHAVSIYSPQINLCVARICRRLSTLNGAVYIANIPWLIKNRTFTASEAVGYIMPDSRSIDIDDAQDLSLAQQLAQEITCLTNNRMRFKKIGVPQTSMPDLLNIASANCIRLRSAPEPKNKN